MQIYGLQKMTLLDYPGNVACTVFLNACDFRCPFCHNFELVEQYSYSQNPIMSQEELFTFLNSRRGLLDGVAITGGEPCIHTDLPDLIEGVRSLGYKVKLDTNGYHPDMLFYLLKNKMVDYVAMDIKNSPQKYASTCGVDYIDIDIIEQSISHIMKYASDYEFRTTVVKEYHSPEDFKAIGRMIINAKQYFLQPFVRRDTVPHRALHSPDDSRLEACLDVISGYVLQAEIRGI